MRPLIPAALAALLLTATAAAEDAGVSSKSEDYRDVVIAHHKGNDLESEIRAESADARGLSDASSVVNMLQVSIDIYNKMPPGVPTDADVVPPLRMRITGKFGIYRGNRKPGGRTEYELKLYSDKDSKVKVECYEYREGKFDAEHRSVQTTVFCDNATWDSTRQVLTGTGDVTILRETSTLRGVDMRYEMRDRPAGEAKRGEGDPGGVFVLYRKVNMQFQEPAPAGKTPAPAAPPRPVVVTCDGIGSYNLDTQEVQFQKNVKVDRPDMDILGDNLRVIMDKGDKREIDSMIAWGNVTIKGKPASGGAERKSYTGYGDDARYNSKTGELLLFDHRPDKNPYVMFGENKVEDDQLRLDAGGGELNRLQGVGGAGRAEFHRQQAATASQPGKTVVTVVTYKDSLDYARADSLVLFKGGVVLAEGNLRVNSELLRVELTPGADPDKPGAGVEGSIRKMTAEGNVVITEDDIRATATRADLDNAKNILHLYGPPQPQIEQPGSRLTSPEIIILQDRAAPEEAIGIIQGRGGPGTFVMLPKEAQAGEGELATREKSVIIRYDDWMQHDNRKTPQKAEFHKNVVATSEDYVLRSDNLTAILVSNKVSLPGGGAETRTEMESITATGNATLHSGRRHFKGAKIVRDVPKREMTLYGSDQALAEAWEEEGTRFIAPHIISREQYDAIQATGPGRMTVPDGVLQGEGGQATQKNAVVTYQGDALYQKLANNTSRAVFRKNVVMVRESSGMTVGGENLTAFLDEAPGAPDAEQGGEPGKMPQQLRRMLMEKNVVVTQGDRTARGVTGELQVVPPNGDIVTLRGDDNFRAVVEDRGGMKLFAPKVVVLQATDVVNADAPGELYIANTQALSNIVNTGGSRGPEKAVEGGYRVLYDGEFIYNSLAQKIKISKNVRLYREDLDSRCDALQMELEEDKSAVTPGQPEGEKKLKVKTIDAEGNVRFKRFPPVKFRSDETRSPLDRPGKSVYTKSAQAHYDVDANKIKLFGGPPDPLALQQTTEVNDHGEFNRSRLQTSAAEYLMLDTVTGDVKGYPRSNTSYKSAVGPMNFDDD